MKIGTVPYTNALPLTVGLTEHRLMALPPRFLAQAVLDGSFDAALVPVAGIVKHGLHAYPEAGLIGCDGAVKSVGLFLKDGIDSPEAIETIYFDGESETSVQLAKIILERLYGRNPKSFKSVSIEDCREADAQLLIGDKALFFQEEGYSFWDLGQLWKQLTGEGFVFACWASKRPLSPRDLATLKSGQIPLASYTELLGPILPAARREAVLKYLQHNIVTQATPSVMAGFKRFQAFLTERQNAAAALSLDMPFPEFDVLV